MDEVFFQTFLTAARETDEKKESYFIDWYMNSSEYIIYYISSLWLL